MKKITILATLSIIGLLACESKKEDSSAKELKLYVDSVTATDNYTSEQWAEIETGYTAKLEKAQTVANEESEKKEIAESKAKFEEHKAKAESSKASEVEQEITRKKIIVRTALFGENKIGNDLSFAWVNASNILSVYDRFVETVKANKELYSREDWDEVKVLYEALDTRKNEVEKELATKDNLKIAKLKTEFATIETTGRIGAKAQENADAKQ